MKLTVANSIFKKHDLYLGIIIAKGIDNEKANDLYMENIRKQQEIIRQEHKDKKTSEIPQIKVWRETYSSFGAKPKKYKSSIEALFTRILAGEDLPAINPLVNIYNFLSTAINPDE